MKLQNLKLKNRWALRLVALPLIAILAMFSHSRLIEAQTAPPTLTGEVLSAYEGARPIPPFLGLVTALLPVGVPLRDGNIETSGCSVNENGGKIRFTVSGVAVGPYPGEFIESGTITVGPRDANFFNTRAILELDVNFTVNSPIGQVTGRKFITNISGPSFARFSNVECNSYPTTANKDILTGRILDARYEAQIQTATGTFTDRGKTALAFSSGVALEAAFAETFIADLPAPVANGPATVTLSPATAVNPVGTTHTVTATVNNAGGQPVPNVKVLFTVTGASNTSGSCTTGSNGQCSFTYQGPQFPGTDVITGCADSNNNGTIETGEPCGAATKQFVFPESPPGEATGGGQVLNLSSNSGVNFAFNFKSDAKGLEGNCNIRDQAKDTKIRCVDVLVYAQTGNHAIIFGNAEMTDATGQTIQTLYRIEVIDNGEPGSSDFFSILTASGYTASGILTQGNIQVHE